MKGGMAHTMVADACHGGPHSGAGQGAAPSSATQTKLSKTGRQVHVLNKSPHTPVRERGAVAAWGSGWGVSREEYKGTFWGDDGVF